ncbi:MAG: hypothetical protein FJ033_10740 [Chloroflexi bacterium]|nr:hypothetical protein [Chloroflexota bacterium]
MERGHDDRSYQPNLPGMRATDEAPQKRRRTSTRGRSYRDPAEIEARATNEHKFEDWRDAFGGFLARLSPERRAELRAWVTPRGEA